MDRPYLHLPCYRISDLACPTGLLTANQWDNTIIRYASYSRKSNAWIDERQRERPIIIGDIPTASKRAIDAPAPPFKDGDIVLAVDKAHRESTPTHPPPTTQKAPRAAPVPPPATMRLGAAGDTGGLPKGPPQPPGPQGRRRRHPSPHCATARRGRPVAYPKGQG